MPIVYSKDRKSLQFPANCDGYLQVPYTAGQQKTGIWAHSGGFTFEALITPPDRDWETVMIFCPLNR